MTSTIMKLCLGWGKQICGGFSIVQKRWNVMVVWAKISDAELLNVHNLKTCLRYVVWER